MGTRKAIDESEYEMIEQLIRRKEVGLPGTGSRVSPRPKRGGGSVASSLENTMVNSPSDGKAGKGNGILPALKQTKSTKREPEDFQRLRLSKGIAKELQTDKYRDNQDQLREIQKRRATAALVQVS